MQSSGPLPAHAGWAVEGVQAGAVPTGGHEAVYGGLQPDLAGQLLAAQLQRLSLCSRVPVDELEGGRFCRSSPFGGSLSSPHLQLDPGSFAADLLARLRMGAGMPGSLPGQPPGLAAAARPAAAATVEQQQCYVPAGRRRGSSTHGVRNEEKVRRTIYISDISERCTEAQLAGFFRDCGQLVDVRVCGDPNSSMRFAFVEFTTELSALRALSKSGSILGNFPIRVSPSKTAIVPVNNTYLPRSIEERELVARTVFVGNVDRVVERDQLREFFENLCGPVTKIRLLGESQQHCKIAFVEFATAGGAGAALKLSGALLGTLPLRVSPSKTPVRSEARRNHDARAPPPSAQLAVPGLPAGLPVSTGVRLPGATAPQQAMGHTMQLPPALLMAVAGLQLHPGALLG